MHRGKEVIGKTFGPWVRPISDRPTAEVMEVEYLYADNTSPQLLDVIEVPFGCAQASTQSSPLVLKSSMFLGTVGWHAEALGRLVRQLHLPEGDMFSAQQEVFQEAYRLQGD